MQHQKKDDEMNDVGEDKEYRMTIWNAIKEAAVRGQVLLLYFLLFFAIWSTLILILHSLI